LEEAFRDYPRQRVRESKKDAGFPASSDVAELASMILSLRSAVESHLGGRKIAGAVVTIPHLHALYQEDVDDALEYAGLISLASWPYWTGSSDGFFPESAAAYAGNGFGLCSNYTDVDSCERERIHPPPGSMPEDVLSISYTQGFLSSTWARQSRGFSTSEREYYFIADLNLGWASKDKYSDDDYWAVVRDAVITPVLLANQYLHRVTDKVIFHGEMASNPRFRSVIGDTLEMLLPNKPPTFDFDPSFAAARGAAEMAKRLFWSYNHTRTNMNG
jgi:hypothetical protein